MPFCGPCLRAVLLQGLGKTLILASRYPAYCCEYTTCVNFKQRRTKALCPNLTCLPEQCLLTTALITDNKGTLIYKWDSARILLVEVYTKVISTVPVKGVLFLVYPAHKSHFRKKKSVFPIRC